MVRHQDKGWFSILDLLIGVALLGVPSQLRWSSRSRRLLALCGVSLFGKHLLFRLFGMERHTSIARLSDATIGATLLGGQYLLSEEDSAVRGSIAGMGGLLLLLAFLRRNRRRRG